MSYEEKVYTKLKQHYHCAQAIFATYASDYGMDQETAYRTMACFAAGMYRGSVCGCVTAALAVLGLAYGFQIQKIENGKFLGQRLRRSLLIVFRSGWKANLIVQIYWKIILILQRGWRRSDVRE